jgi:predicted Zn-ribbon and HTH transcriptional regulator
MSARDLSQAIGIREKELYDDLSQVARLTAPLRRRLLVQPSRYLICGYVLLA